MRVFIAIEPPDALKGEIAQWIETLARAIPDPKRRLHWVKKEQLHLTLKFLGETKPDLLPLLAEALRNAGQEAASFPLSFAKVGHFGGRVIWLGIDAGANQCANIAKSIDAACHALGFELESRPFSPHITLARAKENPGNLHIAQLPPALIHRTFGPFTVTGFSLIQSTLTPKGAIYRPLERFTFNG